MKHSTLIDSLIFCLSLGLYFLIYSPKILIVFLISIEIYRLFNCKEKWKKYLIIFDSMLLIATLMINSYVLLMSAATITGMTGLILTVANFMERYFSSIRIKRILGIVAIIITTTLHLIATYIVFNPDFLTSHAGIFFSETKPPKDTQIPSVQKLENNIILYNNLTYPSIYKNNTLDIYTCPSAKGTIFYIHGGGYAAGDKWNRREYLLRYVKDGYNVVNVNYLLSPEAHYPDSLKQVDEALYFIVKNSDIYNINPNKIVLSGDSAGGQIAGQLALVLTNKNYDEDIGYEPKTKILPKGFIGVSAWSDIKMGLNIGSPILDWFTDKIARSYFNTVDIQKSKQATEASLIKNVNKDFPASFISDGNTNSFTKSNITLVKRLKSLGVNVHGQFYSKQKVILKHIFELNLKNMYAQEVYKKQLDFLDEILIISPK